MGWFKRHSSVVTAPQWGCSKQGHVLETERLILRPFHRDDFDELVGSIDDEVVYWNGFPSDADELRTAMKRMHTGFAPDPYREQWVIVDREAGRIIGERVIFPQPDQPGSFGTGSWLVVDKRGQGLGVEELTAVLALCANHAGLRRVVASTSASNDRALGQYRKLGFQETTKGLVKLPNGQRVESISLSRELKSGDLI